MPVLRRRSAVSLIVTQSLTPSKRSAPPCLPVVVQAAWKIVPVWPFPVVSASDVPLPASNEYAAIGVGAGGALLSTVTPTFVAVVECPAASRATAVSVCDPLSPVVSQVTAYGAVVSSLERLLP